MDEVCPPRTAICAGTFRTPHSPTSTPPNGETEGPDTPSRLRPRNRKVVLRKLAIESSTHGKFRLLIAQAIPERASQTHMEGVPGRVKVQKSRSERGKRDDVVGDKVTASMGEDVWAVAATHRLAGTLALDLS